MLLFFFFNILSVVIICASSATIFTGLNLKILNNNVKKKNHNPFNRMKTQKSMYWPFNKTATTNPEKYYSTCNNPNKT